MGRLGEAFGQPRVGCREHSRWLNRSPPSLFHAWGAAPRADFCPVRTDPPCPLCPRQTATPLPLSPWKETVGGQRVNPTAPNQPRESLVLG